MLNDAKDLQAVYIVCGYTDLRKGIDSLSNIISQTYGMDPFQPGTLFMFCGRKTDRIKALIWEGDGFLLCYKRLEQKASKFQWPRSQEEVCKLTSQQFRWLMEGLTIQAKMYSEGRSSPFGLNLWIKYSCQNDFIHGFKKLSHISLHAFMFYDSVVL